MPERRPDPLSAKNKPSSPPASPESVPLESPMPRSRSLDNEEPELAQEDDIPADGGPAGKDRDHAPR